LTNVPTNQKVKLEFVRPSNHAFATKDQGSNEGKDSDASTSNGRTATFQLTQGSQTYNATDAGLLAPGTVEAFVWDDQDGDGIQDSNEPGIPNVVVKLLRENNSKIKQASTNSSGLVTLTNVPTNQKVKLEFVKPSNQVFTQKDQGTNEGKDSDASTSNGRTATFQLSQGSQAYSATDAGLVSGSGQARQAAISKSIVLPTIYPNPSDGRMILSDVAGYERLTVFDLSGRVVETIDKTSEATKIKIDLSHLPKGVYSLTLEGVNVERFIQRIVLN
ncbi:MAG: SdrD B-like domain-containing protein, partial [Bacteroidota bacterium]